MSPFSSLIVKEEASEKILEFRKIRKKSKSKKVRRLLKPTRKEINFEINYRARNPMHLLKWDEIPRSKKTDPPALRDCSDNEVKSLVKGNPKALKKIAKLYCHSQLNEQMVQMVAKSVKKTNSHKRQKTSIICTKKSQEDVPLLSTKKDFKFKRKLFPK